MVLAKFVCFGLTLFVGGLSAFLEARSFGQLAIEDIFAGMLKVYYINLDKSGNRRMKMQALKTTVGLPVERFQAIDRARIAAGEFNAEYMNRQGIKNSTLLRLEQTGSLNTTLACFVSHVEALQKAQRDAVSPEQYVMILEDDVDVPQDWKSMVRDALHAAPQDWKMLKLSGWGWKRRADMMGVQNVYERSFYLLQAPYWDGPFSMLPHYGGSGAYLMKAKHIPSVIHHVRNQPITDYDEMLLSEDGSFRAYEIFPHLFDLRPEHELSEIRPNGIFASGRWLLSKVEHVFF